MNEAAKKGQRSDLIQDIYEFQKKYSYYRKVIKPARTSFYIIFPLVVELAILVLTTYDQSTGSMTFTHRYGDIIALVITLSLFLYGIHKTNKYVYNRQEFKRYSSFFIKNKLKRISKLDNAFMRQYRIDELKSAFKDIFYLYDQEKAQCVIDIIQIEKEKIKGKRWWPISLLALLFFPLWSEYIGFRFNVILTNTDFLVEKLPELGIQLMFDALIPMAVLIFFSTLLFKVILEEFSLFKHEKMNEIEVLIRLIKIDLPKEEKRK